MIFLLALVGVLGVSASGPIVAATPSVPPLAMAFWRNGLGAATMGAGAVIRARGIRRWPTPGEWRYCVTASIALAVHFACFMVSVRMTTVAAATALVCLQSAWIAGFQRLRGAIIGRTVFGGMGLALAGAVLITGFDVGRSPEALLGDLLALAGGAMAGAYTLAGSKARATMDTGSYTTLCYAMTAMLLAVMVWLADEPIIGFPLPGWVGIIALTVASQLLGHTVFNHLVAALGPLVVSMIILLEIPGAAILAGIFLEQTPPVWTYVGLGLILAGLLAVIRGQGGQLPARTREREGSTRPGTRKGR